MKNRFFAASLLALVLVSPWSARAQVSIGISIGIPPPPLPIYVQPAIPAPGYLWTPGYWAWSPVDNDYYWVPGTWVRPPRIGVLWTPGYWAFVGGMYRWNPGYWGPRVGFYGGINYGYGYVGSGYVGGRWSGSSFQYNTAVNNINTTVVRNINVYNTKVVNVTNTRNVAYNGGPEGINAKPTREEQTVTVSQRIKPTQEQVEQAEIARKTPTQRASVNKGAPQVAATPKAREWNAQGVVRATNSATLAARAGQPDTAKNNEGKHAAAAAGETPMAGASKGGNRGDVKRGHAGASEIQASSDESRAVHKGKRPAATSDGATSADESAQRRPQRASKGDQATLQRSPKSEREPKAAAVEPYSREERPKGSAGRVDRQATRSAGAGVQQVAIRGDPAQRTRTAPQARQHAQQTGGPGGAQQSQQDRGARL